MRVTDNGAEVGAVRDANGERVVGWVTPHISWRGRERWEAKVEREFAGRWRVHWRAPRRFKTRDKAVDAVMMVLGRVDASDQSDFARWLNGSLTRFCATGYHEDTDYDVKCLGTIRTAGIESPCLCECHVGSCLAARLDGPDHQPYLCQRKKGHDGSHHVSSGDWSYEW